MTCEPTHEIRAAMIAGGLPEMEAAEAIRHGEYWTTKTLQEDFTVHSFGAPFVWVTKKDDGASGTLMFTNSPRFYFRWEPVE
jgi:hypothetical protein